MRGKGKQGWSSVLAFDKKPSVDLNKNGELRIFFLRRKYSFISNVDLHKWYNISIKQKPKNKKVFFTVTIDGREVHSVENTNPKTFTNIGVFAGDKSKPPADASYRNLLWETFNVDHSFNIGTKILNTNIGTAKSKNNWIGTIDSKLFRVSFDLIIHSHRKSEWSHLLGFIREDAKNIYQYPVIYLHRSGYIQFAIVFDNIHSIPHYFNFNIELNHWYNILIEQKSVNGKVLRLI